ncbi:YibE/F family protein [Auritidibacter ignavus]|nr:YibE/F family protein [Auritidibacter ignavus]NIH72749.1 putative membrane protein [Auritidibacter ignavus]NIH72816.1 putative membrane protein [Auritidibacter ignavus]RMX23821.1 YibE/F family protein [Auritidibacter ignavus]WGH87174.1 YibE/F family protein [Auritidibacter ignavus]WGH89459.1 YibE/F family protein [Auritidibacter ignavus]
MADHRRRSHRATTAGHPRNETETGTPHAGHGHGLPAGPSADGLVAGTSSRKKRRVIGWLTGILAPLTLVLIIGMVLLWPSGSYRELTLDDPYGTTENFTITPATVIETAERSCQDQNQVMESTTGAPMTLPDSETGASPDCHTAWVNPDGGGSERVEVEIPPQVSASASIEVGDRLKILRPNASSGFDTSVADFVDFERTVPIVLLAGLYALVVVLVARWRGVRAIIGLVASFAVIFFFMIPALLEGGPPLWIGLVGCCLIMVAVLYFAHGFSLRTTTALLGTLLGLGLTAGLAIWSTDAAYLTGMGEEESFVLSSVVPDIRLSGIVLCGLLIAGLGVLNDVTITQSSAVWELQAANPQASARELFSAGMRIGRDHIASTVYTIAFAYAGSALPVMMVISMYETGLGTILVSSELAEEVVRILVGSIGLVLAIPATTAIAVVVARAVSSDS